MDPQIQNIIAKLEVSFKQIDALLAGLTPRNSIETDSLSLLKNQIKTIKTGVKAIIATSNNPATPETSNLAPANIGGTENIEEMTSAAGGSAMGPAPTKARYKAKRGLKIESLAQDAEYVLREQIRESLKALYSEHGDLIFEADENIAPWTDPASVGQTPENEQVGGPTTGTNILGDPYFIWRDIRKVIETTYLKLTTDYNQRLSYQHAILNEIHNILSKVDAGEDLKAAPVSKDAFIDKDTAPGSKVTKQPNFAEIDLKKITNILVNDSGNKVSYLALDNEKDKQAFKDKLFEQLELLFKHLENQFQDQGKSQAPPTDLPKQAPPEMGNNMPSPELPSAQENEIGNDLGMDQETNPFEDINDQETDNNPLRALKRGQ